MLEQFNMRVRIFLLTKNLLKVNKFKIFKRIFLFYEYKITSDKKPMISIYDQIHKKAKNAYSINLKIMFYLLLELKYQI